MSKSHHVNKLIYDDPSNHIYEEVNVSKNSKSSTTHLWDKNRYGLVKTLLVGRKEKSCQCEYPPVVVVSSHQSSPQPHPLHFHQRHQHHISARTTNYRHFLPIFNSHQHLAANQSLCVLASSSVDSAPSSHSVDSFEFEKRRPLHRPPSPPPPPPPQHYRSKSPMFRLDNPIGGNGSNSINVNKPRLERFIKTSSMLKLLSSPPRPSGGTSTMGYSQLPDTFTTKGFEKKKKSKSHKISPVITPTNINTAQRNAFNSKVASFPISSVTPSKSCRERRRVYIPTTIIHDSSITTTGSPSSSWKSRSLIHDELDMFNHKPSSPQFPPPLPPANSEHQSLLSECNCKCVFQLKFYYDHLIKNNLMLLQKFETLSSISNLLLDQMKHFTK